MDNDDLAELYRNRFPEQELQRKNAVWKVICKHYFQQYIGSADTVLDLACGHGEFINNIAAGEKIALDINPHCASYLDRGTRFESVDATQFGAMFSGQVDVVFTSNFLEHLPDKNSLERLLEQIHQALKPGGRYMIMGPNLRYLPGAYWDYYDHHLALTHLSLAEVLLMKGFQLEVCVDRFLPYTTRGALPTHPLLVRAYLAFPFAWRLLGKQFFVVARKPA